MDVELPHWGARPLDQECLASHLRHQNPQTQPINPLQGDYLFGAHISLTFCKKRSNHYHQNQHYKSIPKSPKRSAPRILSFWTMRRFKFANEFWRQRTAQALWWPRGSVQAELQDGLGCQVGTLLLRMAPWPHWCPPSLTARSIQFVALLSSDFVLYSWIHGHSVVKIIVKCSQWKP